MQMIETTGWDYKEFIEENRFYVDKTLFIEEVLEKVGKVVLITRPRRFGKTLNLSMLAYYFNIAENNDHLFKNKKITSNVDLYEKHLNKYPVIFLTLKEVKGDSYEEIYSSFKVAIRKLYLKHEYLLESNNLTNLDKKLFNQFLEKEADIGEYKESISTLSYYLHKHYNKKVIILLDEYDSIVNSSSKELYDSVINLLRGVIGSTFKGNECLEKGVLTGILRIAKESLFSGANNIEISTILSDDFVDKFGFTEQEINNTLIEFNLSNKAKEVKDWYNGYLFGRDKLIIYNPFSINNYIKKKETKNYWINTGSNQIIKNLIVNGDKSIKDKLVDLISGGFVTTVIKESISMSQLSDDDALWSLLLFSGYITLFEKNKNLNDLNEYNLKLVNREVVTSMKEILNECVKLVRKNPYDILNSIIEGNIVVFERELKEVVKATLSYNDIKSENSYHTFIAGITSFLRPNYSLVNSNLESGYGRYDLMIEPLIENGYGYVIELKRIKDTKRNLEAKLKRASELALKQIEDNEYYTLLKERKVKKIFLIGLAFEGKNLDLSFKSI